MLKEVLQECAVAFRQTGHGLAYEVATLLEEVQVPENWQAEPQSDVIRFLPQAIKTKGCLPLAHKISAISQNLNWHEAPREMPKSFVGKYCFAMIVGSGGMIENDHFRFGAYLQAPDTFYPSHRHEAVELYLPLSGTADWQYGEGAYKPVEPGTLIHHPSYLPHATTTFSEPMLALWSWTGNLSFDTYTIVDS